MTVTPTAPDRPFQEGGFATLTEALDRAAQGPTGLNLYGLRGELIEALPYATLRERARAMAGRLAGLRLPTVLVQEGGYPNDALGRNLVSVLGGVGEAHA